MAATGVFGLTRFTALASGDVVPSVDISNTSQNAHGSLLAITAANFFASAQPITVAADPVTVSTPVFQATQAWNDAAVTFTAVDVNITSTASATASLLVNLRVGGASQWKVTKAGAVTQTGALTIAGAFVGATTIAASTSVTVTSASAVALTVGLNGATNPAFAVDNSTLSQVAGLKVTGAATGGAVAVVVTDSGAAANLTINALGTGTIGIGSVSTGRVTITPVTTITGSLTLSAALIYGGVTLSNAVTGTGNMVLSASPTLTGTITLAAATATSMATVVGNSAAVVTATATTLFSISSGLGHYLVTAGGRTQGATYACVAFLYWDGSTLIRIGGTNGASSTLTVSGNNVQYTQTSGGNMNVDYQYLHIG